jgi:hypothetical protein
MGCGQGLGPAPLVTVEQPSCSECGDASSIAKVSAVARGGTWSGMSVGGAHTVSSAGGTTQESFGAYSGATYGSTHLAGLLREPVVRIPNGVSFWRHLGVVVAFFVAFFHLTIGFILVPNLLLDLSIGVAAVLYSVVEFVNISRRGKSDREAFLPRFAVARDRWQRAWYCWKHDIVFIPGWPVVATPDQFQAWIWA